MSEYLTAKETAKLVRDALREEFPGVKFSVRSERYAGGGAVHVGWTDGPTVEQVDKVAKPFAGSAFDSMADMSTSRYFWLTPGGRAVPESQEAPEGSRRVTSMADYVFTERDFSPAYRQELENAVVFLSGGGGAFDRSRRYEFAFTPDGGTGRFYGDYGDLLVFQLSQVSPDALAQVLAQEARRRADLAADWFNAAHLEDRTGFYVTVQDAGRYGLLLGPYATREQAEGDVPEGKRLAKQSDDRAVWYAYGVTKVVMKPGGKLPAGQLEHLTGRQMALAALSAAQAA